MNRNIVLVLSIAALTAYAQEKTPPASPPDTVYGWKNSLVAGFTLTQVAYRDWVQGGDNALSWTFSADGNSAMDQPETKWSNSYKLALGQARLGSQGLRKTDDRIELESVLLYKAGIPVDPYAGASLKTQFAKGYTYDATGNGTEVSQFFDPAYLTQSAGVAYQPIKEAKTRLGLGLREIITNKFNQYADDPTTKEVEKTLVEGGLESVTNLDWPIDEDLLLTSQFEVFAPFKKFDNPALRNITSLTAKVGKYIVAILAVQMIKEPQVSSKAQIKETIALGLSYTIF
ncbi:MAG: DUF3078 domain-containing protein [Bacteroidota bacterium]